MLRAHDVETASPVKMALNQPSTPETAPEVEAFIEQQRARKRRGPSVLSLTDVFAYDRRLRANGFRVVPGMREDIPALVQLLNNRKMPVALPLKFPRTCELLEATWPTVRWLLARSPTALLGCIELRPFEAESGVWEMGSFSISPESHNPRVPFKLNAAAFRSLLELGAPTVVVETHKANTPVWRYIARYPFFPDAGVPDHPDFLRYRMKLDAGTLPLS